MNKYLIYKLIFFYFFRVKRLLKNKSIKSFLISQSEGIFLVEIVVIVSLK